MKKILFIFPIAILLAAGCNSPSSTESTNNNGQSAVAPQTPTQTASQQGNNNMAGLQSSLENVYKQLRAALLANNYDDTMALLEQPAKHPYPPKDQFNQPQVYKTLAFHLPDLNTVKFIQVRQNGGWAGYYFQTHPDDTNYVNLSMVRFHNINGGWKVYGAFDSYNWPATGSNKTIDSEISTDPTFKLPNEAGYSEK